MNVLFFRTHLKITSILVGILIIYSGINSSLTAQNHSTTKVATTVAQFLKIGVHPRGAAMGGAFVALADDISALYWNPAGVARSDSKELLFTQGNWFVDTRFYYVAASVSLGSYGNMGLAITQLNYGEMDVRTEKEPDGTGERFTAADLALALSYAKNLTDRFSMGGTFKYIQQQIWNMFASTIAIDLGVLFISQFKDIRLGMSITNYGMDMMLKGRNTRITYDPEPTLEGNNDQISAVYELEAWPIPLSFRVGIAGNLVQTRSFSWVFAADALHPNDNSEYINLGSEIGFGNTFFLRGGYRTLFAIDRQGGASLGAGIRYPLSPTLKIKIDYSWTDYGFLHSVSRLSLSIEY